jgi:hypothetical protein
VGSDRSQLANMAKAAKEAIGTETLEAVADRRYSTARRSRGAPTLASQLRCPSR